MKNNMILIAGSLVLALAACNKSGQQNASAGGSGGGGSSAPSILSGASQMQPGLWEMSYETTNVTGAGIPAAYLAQMKGHKETRRDCITPEQAAHPMAKMVEAQQKGQCNFSGFSIAGGRIQGTVTCGDSKTPGKMTMTMNGQYDATNYAYTNRMTTEGRGMNMTIESQAVAHRVGDCPAGGAGD